MKDFLFFATVVVFLGIKIVSVLSYEARVRFGTQVWVWMRDLAIFEKSGCGCGWIRQLKNY